MIQQIKDYALIGTIVISIVLGWITNVSVDYKNELEIKEAQLRIELHDAKKRLNFIEDSVSRVEQSARDTIYISQEKIDSIYVIRRQLHADFKKDTTSVNAYDSTRILEFFSDYRAEVDGVGVSVHRIPSKANNQRP